MNNKELAWKFGSIAGRIHDQTVQPVTYKQDPSEVIEQYLKENGLVIVPAGDVPTPEDRAAVRRIAAERQAYVEITKEGPTAAAEERRYRAWLKAQRAIQPGDIEAAQRVAEGGK